MERPLISIIMPAYQAARHIGEAITSVLAQTYTQWELIIVDDGSSDETAKVISQYNHDQIFLIRQENRGVSAARSKGLSLMRGSYFCFLDADDLMPADSLFSRLKVFTQDPSVTIVGGAQEVRSNDLAKLLRIQKPTFSGNPTRALARLEEGCFINCGTWLIKRDQEKNYTFPEGWTHAEDLAFFFSISENQKLEYTSEIAQIYRQSTNSAMSNLKGLELGYWRFYQVVAASPRVGGDDVAYLKNRILRIMVLSYLHQKKISGALGVLWNYLRRK